MRIRLKNEIKESKTDEVIKLVKEKKQLLENLDTISHEVSALYLCID
jgi:hypothetical protein